LTYAEARTRTGLFVATTLVSVVDIARRRGDRLTDGVLRFGEPADVCFFSVSSGSRSWACPVLGAKLPA